jgi:glutamate dehydrogenase (NADP+)
MYIQKVLEDLNSKYYHQPEFIQAAAEVFGSISLLLERDNRYEKHRILERIVEPEKIIKFRVVWEKDDGEIEINQGIRYSLAPPLAHTKAG